MDVSAESGVGAPALIRYVRVENPTAHLMSWQEIEVMSGGRNLVANHPEMISGTTRDGGPPTNQARRMTDGEKDPMRRGPSFEYATTNTIGSWLEVDLGSSRPVDEVILYASEWVPGHFEYFDKGHRIITLLDEQRRVVWAEKWDQYDRKRFPEGIFTFRSSEQNRAVPFAGKTLPKGPSQQMPTEWLFELGEEKLPQDAEARMARFAERNSQASMKALADEFFRLLEPEAPGLEEARRHYASGEYQQALEAWRTYWFAKMERVALSLPDPGRGAYGGQGDDMVKGIGVSLKFGSRDVIARRFTPGRIFWVDIPQELKEKAQAMEDTAGLAIVDNFTRPLLLEYNETGDAKYLQRWAEISDDWAMNFFADADASRYNVKNLFVMHSAEAWARMMEDLSSIAKNHPELKNLISASTLARVQLICLEQYGPAYWRLARETVFNHNTTGILMWGLVFPYIDEFRPTTRVAREWRQHLERWMTLAVSPDGSMVEISDEGHFTFPFGLGFEFNRFDKTKPSWYTPGWRNRATEYFDGLYKYIFRHPAPGGAGHRAEYRRYFKRFTDFKGGGYDRGFKRGGELLDRNNELYSIPEMRRILDTICYVSAGEPELDPKAPGWAKRVRAAKVEAREDALKILGEDQPGEPHIKSDWMPYTGSYYFRSGWAEGNAFLAMLARGARGGSAPDVPSWSYGMIKSFDYGFPLMQAETLTINGLPQRTLGENFTFMPGSKTGALTYADREPATHRWHSSDKFAVGEALFNGSYQKVGLKWGQGYNVEPNAGEPELSESRIDKVRSNRQIFQLRESRLFIVADTVHFADPAERGDSHRFGESLLLMLSTLKEGASAVFSPDRLQINETENVLKTLNSDGPNVSLYQFAADPLTYRKGAASQPDFQKFLVSDNVGIAPQQLSVAWEAQGDSSLVTLISSSSPGDVERVSSVKPMNNGPTLSGFEAELVGGKHVWFQVSASGVQALSCGPVQIKGEGLLVTRSETGEIAGIAFGASSLAISGKGVRISEADFEFILPAKGELSLNPIYRPISTVRFSPDRNTFNDAVQIEMTCATPGVEIRYTTDGTQPTRDSQLYTKAITLTETAEFAARAYRLGRDGKPLPADDFEINGTRFTVPSYGWFYKKPLNPAIKVDMATMASGLTCEHLKGEWTRLFSQGHWIPAVQTSVAEREMDLKQVKSNDYYGARFKGYINIPESGVYTFHAPSEFVLPDVAASYDLRAYVDGEEWYLTQWWHGHGTWSVPLEKGFHRFEVDFADARTIPWKQSGLWRYYPRPWATYQGDPSPILISGPRMEKQRIPKEWLHRDR